MHAFSHVLRPHARVILAAVVPAKGDEDAARLDRVRAALQTAQVICVAEMIQRRGVSRARHPGGVRSIGQPLSPATYLGRGKVEELAILVRDRHAEYVVVANRLSHTQEQRLAALLGIPVCFYCGLVDAR